MTSDNSSDTSRWEAQLNALLDQHFADARNRVPDIYEKYFHSLRAVALRHWHCRRDIPRDLATIPRFTWRALRRLVGAQVGAGKEYSAKERVLAALISSDLLALPQLEQKLLQHLELHPALELDVKERVQEALAGYSPEEVQQRVHRAVSRLSVDHDGSRDMLMFLVLGVAGRALSDKAVFGSAGVLGASVASSVYISQQSYFVALWVKWFGVPAWVQVAGAATGFASVLLVTPLIAPLVECSINRFRAERMLTTVVDSVQQQMRGSRNDGYTLAAYAGTYLQLLPDVLSLLRSLR